LLNNIKYNKYKMVKNPNKIYQTLYYLFKSYFFCFM
jgi:hypothetical protein